MKRHLPKIVLGFALLLLGSGYALKVSDVFIVNGIEITGSERVSTDQIPVVAGSSIFEVDLNKVVDSIMCNTFVEHAKARFDLQGVLKVTVIEKEPICYLYTNHLYGVTSRCELLPVSCSGSVASLPVVSGIDIGSVQLYKPVDRHDLHVVIKLIDILRIRYPQRFASLSEVIVNSEGIKLILEPGSVVANVGLGDYRHKIDMLEIILAGNSNPGLNIDLRFGDCAIMKTRKILDREVNDGV